MKTRTLKPTKVNVVTLGCSKNTFDSEVMMAQLKANGITVDHESDSGEHNVVVINTCGFIDNAQQESIDTILSYAKAKDAGLVEKVYVTGCLSQRYAPELKDGIPQIDAWFGTRDLPRLLKTLKADYKKELVGERLLTTPAHYAYFKISEGCDRLCTYCAIPKMRGKHATKPIEEVVHLLQRGLEKRRLEAENMRLRESLSLYKVGEAIARFPHALELVRSLGRELAVSNAAGEARAIYRQLEAMAPRDVQVHIDLAILFIYWGNVRKIAGNRVRSAWRVARAQHLGADVFAAIAFIAGMSARLDHNDDTTPLRLLRGLLPVLASPLLPLELPLLRAITRLDNPSSQLYRRLFDCLSSQGELGSLDVIARWRDLSPLAPEAVGPDDLIP